METQIALPTRLAVGQTEQGPRAMGLFPTPAPPPSGYGLSAHGEGSARALLLRSEGGPLARGARDLSSEQMAAHRQAARLAAAGDWAAAQAAYEGVGMWVGVGSHQGGAP